MLVGANLFGLLWEYTNRATVEEKAIFELGGKGLYYELQQQYAKAIELYQKADNLTMQVFNKEINKLIQTNGDGNYLHTKILKSRIGRCKYLMHRDKINKFEAEAKELEKNNPEKAIKKI